MIYTITLNPALDKELEVSRLSVNEVLRAGSVRQDIGGKGINVSKTLSELGIESTALGFLGGAAGETIAVKMKTLNIKDEFVRIRGETRVNVSIVTRRRSDYIKVNEPGPTVTKAEADQLRQKIATLAGPGDWWVLSGSLPAGLPDSFCRQLIEEIQNKGARLLFDAEGNALSEGCLAKPWLVKPNTYEAGQLTGIRINDKYDAMNACRKIHSLGVPNVVLTMGKQGALLSEGNDKVWHAWTLPVGEQNPIGAGDALMAGLICGFDSRLSSKDTLSLAVACGAAAASEKGTAPADNQQINRILEAVTCVSNPAKIDNRV